MLFNSFEFLVFYIAVVVVFFALPHRFRWGLLLAASYYFYMSWKPEYVVLILGSTLIDYTVGLSLPRASSGLRRRLLLALSLATNLGLLATFKYWSFLGENVTAVLRAVSIEVDVPGLAVLLPVGISFYTFQSMSYTIDVYRGKTQPTRHFGIFALYVAFFPQLVAGPIERSGRLLPQFWERKTFDAERATTGLRLMLWGLFKKVVIADQVAVVVNTVYANPGAYSGPVLGLATFFFAVQIYCDFSGYSDIAIGAARVMGYDLMTNFRRPYFAASIREFWQRWHISLSTWFRDYLYIPLGGSRQGKLRTQINVLVVFVLSGLWHGAAWTFVAWGFLHGAYLVMENVVRRREAPAAAVESARARQLYGVVKRLWIFVVVLVSWVFFRAASFADAWEVFRGVFSTEGFSVAAIWALGLPRFEMAAAALSIAVLFMVDLIAEASPRWVETLWSRRPVRWAVYLAGFYGIVMLGNFGEVEFIYFQF